MKKDVGLKTHLQQDISGSVFHSDLVNKFRRIVGRPLFPDHFKS